jgi:ATP-dependent RNA circularization protein (DNA/RNA ligase family)
MWVVHDKTEIIAGNFPDYERALTYAHVYSSTFATDKLSISKEDQCSLDGSNALRYVGENICPFTNERTQKFMEVT